MKKNLDLQELKYDKYKMNIKEITLYSLQGIVILGLFGYFFYRSFIITIIGSPMIIFYLKWKSKTLCESRKQALQIQFKEVLISVKGSLQAGYSLENAFIDSYRDIASFYGESCVMCSELKVIKAGLKNGKTITQLMHELGRRSRIDDIKDFASVLVIGKQTGGNLNDIMDSFINVMEEKVAVLEEISTMISSRKYEQKIMNAIPFFIIFYIELTSKGFFNCLYHNVAGQIIMTICLILYLVGIYMSNKITNIVI